MTKVRIRFRLPAPLTAAQLERFSDARGVYGLLDLDLDPAGEGFAVEYDATRLTPEEVAALLRSAGIAAVRE